MPEIGQSVNSPNITNSEAKKAYARAYYQANKDRIKAQARERREQKRDEINAQKRVHYWENRERMLEVSRNWREQNRDYKAKKDREWQLANPERRKAISKRYYEKKRQDPSFLAKNAARSAEYASKHPEKIREISRRYYESNPETSIRAYVNRKQRSPAWADQEAIAFWYECKPAGCHVDHIIPLQGELVSGLHVAENLQWLPGAENIRKSNRYDPWRDS